MEDATLTLTHLITAARFRYVMLRILWWLFLGTQATGSSMECLWAKTCSENQGFRVLGVKPIQMDNGSSLNIVVHGEWVILQGVE